MTVFPAVFCNDFTVFYCFIGLPLFGRCKRRLFILSKNKINIFINQSLDSTCTSHIYMWISAFPPNYLIKFYSMTFKINPLKIELLIGSTPKYWYFCYLLITQAQRNGKLHNGIRHEQPNFSWTYVIFIIIKVHSIFLTAIIKYLKISFHFFFFIFIVTF